MRLRLSLCLAYQSQSGSLHSILFYLHPVIYRYPAPRTPHPAPAPRPRSLLEPRCIPPNTTTSHPATLISSRLVALVWTILLAILHPISHLYTCSCDAISFPFRANTLPSHDLTTALYHGTFCSSSSSPHCPPHVLFRIARSGCNRGNDVALLVLVPQ